MNNSNTLELLDLSPAIKAFQSFASFLEQKVIEARHACRLNQVHPLISSEHRCPHYVSADKLHLLSDGELITWVKIKLRQKNKDQLEIGMMEVEKRSASLKERYRV